MFNVACQREKYIKKNRKHKNKYNHNLKKINKFVIPVKPSMDKFKDDLERSYKTRGKMVCNLFAVNYFLLINAPDEIGSN